MRERLTETLRGMLFSVKSKTLCLKSIQNFSFESQTHIVPRDQYLQYK